MAGAFEAVQKVLEGLEGKDLYVKPTGTAQAQREGGTVGIFIEIERGVFVPPGGGLVS